MAQRRVRKENMVDRAGRKVANILELPADTFTAMPRISMIGNREMIIEGHTGIISYDPQIITIGGGVFLLEVTGQNLEMNSFSQDSIGIQGIINNVHFVI